MVFVAFRPICGICGTFVAFVAFWSFYNTNKKGRHRYACLRRCPKISGCLRDIS